MGEVKSHGTGLKTRLGSFRRVLYPRWPGIHRRYGRQYHQSVMVLSRRENPGCRQEHRNMRSAGGCELAVVALIRSRLVTGTSALLNPWRRAHATLVITYGNLSTG